MKQEKRYYGKVLRLYSDAWIEDMQEKHPDIKDLFKDAELFEFSSYEDFGGFDLTVPDMSMVTFVDLEVY